MSWLDLLATALASSLCVRTWLLPGGVLECLKLQAVARCSSFNQNTSSGSVGMGRVFLRIAELIECPYCLSHWIPIFLVAFSYIPSLMLPNPWNVLFKLPIYCLAASRLVVWDVAGASLGQPTNIGIHPDYDQRTTGS